MLGDLRKRGLSGLLRHEIVEGCLIAGVAAQAFPGKAFDRQDIVERIVIVVAPPRRTWSHLSTPERVCTRIS